MLEPFLGLLWWLLAAVVSVIGVVAVIIVVALVLALVLGIWLAVKEWSNDG